MSAQDSKKVSARLEQAKREILWAIGALEDTDSLLEEYNLSQRERDKLQRQFHMELSGIESALSRVLSVQSRPREVHIVTEQTIGLTEAVDVSSSGESIRIGRIRSDINANVGEIPTHEDEDSIVGEIPTHEDSTGQE